MSLEAFNRLVKLKEMKEQDRTWFPKWVKGYAVFHGQSTTEKNQSLSLTRESVIGYLQSLRDHKVAAWQRLQAARALSLYQGVIARGESEFFGAIERKLRELAETEKLGAGTVEQRASLVPGEGNAGKFDESEPKPVQELRARMRLLHHPQSTERAYVGWLKRYVRHVGDERLHRFGEQQIAEFLSELDIRTVQELLGHKDVSTTMIYTHVMNRPGMNVVSPMDRLFALSK